MNVSVWEISAADFPVGPRVLTLLIKNKEVFIIHLKCNFFFFLIVEISYCFFLPGTKNVMDFLTGLCTYLTLYCVIPLLSKRLPVNFFNSQIVNLLPCNHNGWK